MAHRIKYGVFVYRKNMDRAQSERLFSLCPPQDTYRAAHFAVELFQALLKDTLAVTDHIAIEEVKSNA